MTSSYKVDGVSSLTLKNGDLTILMEVEDFVIDVKDRYDNIDTFFGFEPPIYKTEETYSIRGSLSVDDNGHAFVVHKQRKSVVRTARIELDRWDVSQIVEAQKATGAPDEAAVRHVRESDKTYVEFEWEELV